MSKESMSQRSITQIRVMPDNSVRYKFVPNENKELDDGKKTKVYASVRRVNICMQDGWKEVVCFFKDNLNGTADIDFGKGKYCISSKLYSLQRQI